MVAYAHPPAVFPARKNTLMEEMSFINFEIDGKLNSVLFSMLLALAQGKKSITPTLAKDPERLKDYIVGDQMLFSCSLSTKLSAVFAAHMYSYFTEFLGISKDDTVEIIRCFSMHFPTVVEGMIKSLTVSLPEGPKRII